MPFLKTDANGDIEKGVMVSDIVLENVLDVSGRRPTKKIRIECECKWSHIGDELTRMGTFCSHALQGYSAHGKNFMTDLIAGKFMAAIADESVNWFQK